MCRQLVIRPGTASSLPVVLRKAILQCEPACKYPPCRKPSPSADISLVVISNCDVHAGDVLNGQLHPRHPERMSGVHAPIVLIVIAVLIESTRHLIEAVEQLAPLGHRQRYGVSVVIHGAAHPDGSDGENIE